MWTAIFSALAAMPKMFEMIQAFSRWLSEQIVDYQKQNMSEDMTKAIVKAKKEKDTTDINNLFSGKKK